MKRLAFWGLSGLLVAATSFAGSVTYYVLELRGGSKIYSVDSPVRKGRLLLFHRYPDGVFLSLTATEVDRISALEAAPPPSEKLAPGGTVYVGPALSGPNFEAPPAPPPSSFETYFDSGSYGYGYGDFYYGGGGYFPPPHPLPPPRVPSNIGPNGFPILAPPGSPGAAPPRIGANGYPIISPPPAIPAPRRR